MRTLTGAPGGGRCSHICLCLCCPTTAFFCACSLLTSNFVKSSRWSSAWYYLSPNTTYYVILINMMTLSTKKIMIIKFFNWDIFSWLRLNQLLWCFFSYFWDTSFLFCQCIDWVTWRLLLHLHLWQLQWCQNWWWIIHSIVLLQWKIHSIVLLQCLMHM